jgi:hypothetical protein
MASGPLQMVREQLFSRPFIRLFGQKVSPEGWKSRRRRTYICRMDDSHIARMRERARQMRRAASMSTNPEIIEILSKAADQAEADAAQLDAELHRQVQPLPPQA